MYWIQYNNKGIFVFFYQNITKWSLYIINNIISNFESFYKIKGDDYSNNNIIMIHLSRFAQKYRKLSGATIAFREGW